MSALQLHYLTEKTGSEDGQFQSESYCLSDSGLNALADGFSKLEKLSLIWCSNISSLGLMSLAQKCLHLKSLDLQVIFTPFSLFWLSVCEFCLLMFE